MAKLPFEEEEEIRDIIVKRESITDPNLGEFPEKRPVNEIINYGIVNIDKPRGPTKLH